MNPAVIDGFTVVGIEARTDNAREMAGGGIIAKQWGRFMGENLLAQIPNRTDGAILAVYSDYESDKDGEYSFMIGARVKGGDWNSGRDDSTEGPCWAVRGLHVRARAGRENRGGDLAEDLVGHKSGARRRARVQRRFRNLR